MGYLPQRSSPSGAAWERTLYNTLPKVVLITHRPREEKTVLESWVVDSRGGDLLSLPLVTSLHFSEDIRFPIHHFLLFPSYRSLSPPPTLSCLFLSLSILLSVLFTFSFSLPHCAALFSFFSISVISPSLPPEL